MHSFHRCLDSHLGSSLYAMASLHSATFWRQKTFVSFTKKKKKKKKKREIVSLVHFSSATGSLHQPGRPALRKYSARCPCASSSDARCRHCFANGTPSLGIYCCHRCCTSDEIRRLELIDRFRHRRLGGFSACSCQDDPGHNMDISTAHHVVLCRSGRAF